MIWNFRDMDSELNRKCYEVYTTYCPRFNGFSGGIQKDDDRIKQFFDNGYTRIEFDHPLFYNRDRFISRCLSGSYSLKEGEAGYQAYMEEWERLFDSYSENGVVKMGNKSAAYIGILE